MKAISFEGSPWGVDDEPGRNRLRQRAQNLFGNNAGLIEGKTVLDLACNNGRMAYGAFQAGAASVTGVEIRDELIEKGRENMEKAGLTDRMKFIKSDIFEYMRSAEPGSFDVILCLGFLYNTVDQVEFFRECARLRPETVIIDTSVAKNYFWFGRRMFGKPPALFLVSYEDPSETRNTFDADGIVYWPSTSYLEEMFRRTGFVPRRIPYNGKTVDDWDAMDDYRRGIRASYVARLKA
jgi:ubiquinone/menaquinone biosynthesis C-methylase UbiE